MIDMARRRVRRILMIDKALRCIRHLLMMDKACRFIKRILMMGKACKACINEGSGAELCKPVTITAKVHRR